MQNPSLTDVLSAQQRIKPYLKPTPLHSYPAINDLIGAHVFIKHENVQPIGAFKVRGGINLISQLSEDEKRRGVITASTGNHGQSVAYASRIFGVEARVVVPEGANPGKVAAMTAMGAEIIVHGKNFDESRAHCEQLAEKHNYRYIHSGNEPHLIAGVGTITLEILQEEPEIQTIIVPLGGGSGASGASIVAKALSPSIQVLAVQSSASPAAYKSWKQKKLVEAPNQTFAEGLATGTAFKLPQSILWKLLDDFILVSEDEILQAMIWMLEKAHTLVEGAGAAPLAAAYKLRQKLKSQKVALVCSGGNVSLKHLKMALDSIKD
ncbi:MAG: threonine/serine dehydratase [Candidatus Hermodarchaeota archaeon]